MKWLLNYLSCIKIPLIFFSYLRFIFSSSATFFGFPFLLFFWLLVLMSVILGTLTESSKCFLSIFPKSTGRTLYRMPLAGICLEFGFSRNWTKVTSFGDKEHRGMLHHIKCLSYQHGITAGVDLGDWTEKVLVRFFQYKVNLFSPFSILKSSLGVHYAQPTFKRGENDILHTWGGRATYSFLEIFCTGYWSLLFHIYSITYSHGYELMGIFLYLGVKSYSTWFIKMLKYFSFGTFIY